MIEKQSLTRFAGGSFTGEAFYVMQEIHPENSQKILTDCVKGCLYHIVYVCAKRLVFR